MSQPDIPREPAPPTAIGLREVLDQAPDLIFACDPSGILLWVNAAVEERAGRPRAEIIGYPVLDLVPPRDRRRIHVRFEAERRRGSVLTSIETRLVAGDGSAPAIVARVRRLDRADGEIYVGVAREAEPGHEAGEDLERRLTQVTQALEQARAVAQLKADALATMTHEIRSPMNGILGLLRILLESPLDRDQRGIVEILQSSSQTLLALMNDTLEFSRLESGHVELQHVDFDAVNVTHDIASMLGPIANEKGLAFDCRVAPDVPRLLNGDPGRIRQVLVNLATNAIKFTDQGSVTIHVEARGQDAGTWDLRFAVADTGIGIAADAVARLFRPYEQADPTIAHRFGGTGLGLSISRKLVQMMGGDLGVDSRPGEGSTFWFDVRLGEAHGSVDAAQAPLSSTAHGAVMLAGLANEIHGPRPLPALAIPKPESGPAALTRVLIVEDSAVNQLVVVWSLQKRGYTVDTAATAEEALTRFTATPYDVVLLDLNLPDWKGQDVAREMRKIEKGGSHRAWIAAMTGADETALESCLEAGMDEFLTKPVDLDVLAARVAAWIGRDREAGGPAPIAADAPSARPANVVPFPTREVEEAPAIDLDQLDTMSMNSPELRETLLQTFLGEIEPRMERIDAALADGDAKALEFEAHGLKGMTGTLGALAARDVFEAIEHHARDGDLAPMPDLVRDARDEAARVTDFILSLPRAEAA